MSSYRSSHYFHRSYLEWPSNIDFHPSWHSLPSPPIHDLFSSSHSQLPSPPVSHSHSQLPSPPISHSHSPSPFTSVVKVEPTEDPSNACFIIENPTTRSTYLNDKGQLDPSVVGTKVASFVSSQALAPPTEVPLRATQAPKKMKGMMGVFRINPFAMHNGSDGKGSAPTVCWEPGPLEEEPVMFEFQLDLIGYGDDEEEEVNGEVDPGSLGITCGISIGGLDEAVVEGVYGEDCQVEPDAQIPTIKLSTTTLHAFPPEFDLHDEFATGTTVVHNHSSERYRSTPSGISQVPSPEDQPQPVASCTDNTNASALLPPDDQRGSPFALEYHHHSHHHQQHQHQLQRPHSAASSSTYAPLRSDGTWNPDAGTVDITLTTSSSRDRQLHVQNHIATPEELDDEQDYQVAVPPPSAAAVTNHAVHYGESAGVVDATNTCSYPSLMTQTVHQQNGYINVVDVPEDPSQVAYQRINQVQTHNVAAVGGLNGLGLYGIPTTGGGHDGSVQVVESGSPGLSSISVVPSAPGQTTTTAAHVHISAHSSSTPPSVVEVNQSLPLHGCSALRQASRGSSHHHRIYDNHHHHHHPYLRPVHNSPHAKVDHYTSTTRDCGYSDYSEEYEYDEKTNSNPPQSVYEQQEYITPTNSHSHSHRHSHHIHPVIGADTTTNGRIWSRSSFAQSMLSGVARAS